MTWSCNDVVVTKISVRFFCCFYSTPMECIRGLVVEYTPATGETRVRFPADAVFDILQLCAWTTTRQLKMDSEVAMGHGDPGCSKDAHP